MASLAPTPWVGMAGVEESLERECPYREETRVLRPALPPSRGSDFETPDQTLSPASSPETPSFHGVCL